MHIRGLNLGFGFTNLTLSSKWPRRRSSFQDEENNSRPVQHSKTPSTFDIATAIP